MVFSYLKNTVLDGVLQVPISYNLLYSLSYEVIWVALMLKIKMEII
jgi:hypothetical protein